MKMVRWSAFAAAALVATAAWASDELDVSARSNGRSLFLASRSSAALGDCTVYVNDGYTASVATIPATGSAEIWLSEFVSKGALRFDPKLERLRRVHVICRKPSYGDALFKID